MRFTQTVKKSICLSLMLLSFQVSLLAESSRPYQDETPAQRNERMAWWRQARFGMFIHWGPYAIPARGEWVMNKEKIPVAKYTELVEQFNPVKFNAEKWVRIAKDAGMRYIVITSKHHDGFAMFGSRTSPYNIVDATPFRRDPLKELAEACAKEGIGLGFYYSQAQDWHHPGGGVARGSWDSAQEGDFDAYFNGIAIPQIKELLGSYGTVRILWCDTPVKMNRDRAERLVAAVRATQPATLINSRLMYSGRRVSGVDAQKLEELREIGADYLSYADRQIPAQPQWRDWETCMTLNESWGYNRADDKWKPSEVLVRQLVEVASKGGNYLLNVGPTAEGEIPQPSIERLKDVGKWMKVNGESIYGTTASPFAKLTWCCCTKKSFVNGAKLYLHIFDWPADGKLVLLGLKNQVQQAYLLADLGKLKTTNDDAGVTVELPPKPLDAIDTVVVVKVLGALDVEKILPTQNADGTVELSAKLADIHHGRHTKLETQHGKQHIGSWTDHRSWVEWTFEVKQSGSFEVIADLASKAAETKFEVVVGSSKLRAEVTSTGGDDQFKKVSLGQIEVPKAGVYTLRIKPIKAKWKPMNLRSVSLTPKK